MRAFRILGLVAVLIAALCSVTMAASGSGDLKIGYIYLDEEGNQSSYHPTFTLYPGATVSLEDFRYRFDNGMLMRANLNNIILNNRNLNASLAKPGLFDLKLSHDQFRRIYDFDGGSFTRRHQERGSLSVQPMKYLKLFGGVLMMERTGTTTDLFEPTSVAETVDIDYKRSYYNVGAQVNYEGSMVLAEYRGDKFTDNNDENRDQKRNEYRFTGLLSCPRYDWVKLIGGFRHYETKFDKSGFMISNNRGYGGGTVTLPKNVTLKYVGILDRTSSDSDFVATDNMSHVGYASWEMPKQFGLTVGYQYDVNDDFEDEVRANSMFVGGFANFKNGIEARGEYGNRKEEVEDGVRLLGDEDRDRFRFSLKYRNDKYGSIAYKMTSMVRKNEQINAKSDFYRYAVDAVVTGLKYGTLNVGYAHTQGKYENSVENFDFRDHLVFGDVTLKEYHGLILGGGAQYYRCKRDLDIEHFNITAKAAYRFYQDYRLEAKYSAYNFDDLLVWDEYYTANLVEVSLVKGLSF